MDKTNKKRSAGSADQFAAETSKKSRVEEVKDLKPSGRKGIQQHSTNRQTVSSQQEASKNGRKSSRAGYSGR